MVELDESAIDTESEERVETGEALLARRARTLLHSRARGEGRRVNARCK